MKKTYLKLITPILLSSVIFTGCYTWFEDKIKMDTESKQITLTDFLYEAPPISELQAPTQVIASQGLYSGTIKLHWNDVPYATSYRIERAISQPDSNGVYPIPDEGDFSVLEKYVFSTNYNDYILAEPKTDNLEYQNIYYYRISAENLVKGYEPSKYTDYKKTDTNGAGWLLPPPDNIDAWKGKSTDIIKISWDAVPNAKKYEIYRGTKANGLGMELLGSVKANLNYYENVVDDSEKGIEFYYKAVAVIDSSSVSAPTGLALGYSLREGAPSTPDNLAVTNGQGKSTSEFTITWDAVEKEGYNISYAVFRNSSQSSIFETVKNNYESNTCTDSNGLKPGIIYYYYVQTIATSTKDGDILKSGFSETGPSDAHPVYAYLLSPPSDVEVNDAQEAGKIQIRWTPAVGYDFQATPYTYSIYYDSTKDGDFSQVLQSGITPTKDSDGYCSLIVDKKNFYKISTTNSDGTESNKSPAVAPTPDAPTNVFASKTEDLGGLNKYTPNINEVYPVKITWSAPKNDEPAGYHVYRSNKPDTGFRKITEEPLSADTFSFIDENETARAGNYYYYKVVSLNVLGQGKKGNNQTNDSRGYGAITREQWFREYNKSIMKSQSKLILMHKSNDMDKLGSETINGDISGTLSYKAAIAGLGAEITMHYENYCDFYIQNDKSLGKYFILTGNTDTTSNMSANGNMHEKVTCTGMYPGYAIYNNLQIKGGAAGGGYYLVETYNQSGKTLLSEAKVDWTVGEER